MGFDLGLAASAYQGVKAEQRRLRDDEFTQAQHDYTRANMDEHTAGRGNRDRAAALADAQVAAKQNMLPLATDVERARLEDSAGALGAAAKDRSFGETTRPAREAAAVGALETAAKDRAYGESTRADREEAGLITAKTGVVKAKTERDHAQGIAEMTEEELKENGDKIDAMIADRADKRADLQDRVLAGVYQAGTTGKMDEHGIVARLNATARSSLFPELKGKTIAHIQKVPAPDGDGDVMELRDADNNLLHTLSVTQMKAAHDRLHQGQVMTMADGVNAYRKNPDGTLTKLTENVKTLAPSRAGAGGGKGNAYLDRVAASFIAEAKAKGQDLSEADANRQAIAAMKSNPGAWAQRALKDDFKYQGEKDLAKRRAMEDEALATARRLGGVGGTPASPATTPGLGAISPKSQAAIDAAIGL